MKCISVSFPSGIYCSKRLTKTRALKTQAFEDEIKSRIRKVSKPIQIFGLVIKRAPDYFRMIATRYGDLDPPRPSIRICESRDIRRYPGLSTDHMTSGISSTVIAIAILPCLV
jgi:hypothetical protein